MAKIQRNDRRALFSHPIILAQKLPKCLYGLGPRSIKGTPWFKKERKIAAIENNYCCWACGVNVNFAKYHKRLEGAPLYEIDFTNKTVTYERTAALCYLCNSFLNIELTNQAFQKGDIDTFTFMEIVTNSRCVLPGVCAPIITESDIDDFGNWKYIIDGEIYEPKFKSFEEWSLVYNSTGE